jgi:WD40 repeat protein
VEESTEAAKPEKSKCGAWKTMTGAVLHTLEGHTSELRSVTFSSDYSRIMSGSDD